MSQRTTLELLLARGMVAVHVDPRRGTTLPEFLLNQPAVVINLSLRFPGAMVIGDEGVCADLQFDGVPFSVVLPWGSIFAVSSHVGAGSMAWPENIPDEIAAGAGDLRERPKLRVVH